jgi:hypothetical protein
MKLAISGAYSSGKTLTVMALSHYTGIPRTLAKTAREILPDAVPGKPLAQLSCAEFVQLIVRRHVERAVHESRMQDGFLADGTSLQEWTFGMARVAYRTMNPAEDARLHGKAEPMTHEMRFFEEVMVQFGHAFKQHVASTFDACVHLRHELPLAQDGHRPMSESFRATCDEMLLSALAELAIPHHVVGGTTAERLDAIVELHGFATVMDKDEAIALAQAEHAEQDMRYETERARLVLQR